MVRKASSLKMNASHGICLRDSITQAETATKQQRLIMDHMMAATGGMW